MAHTGVLLTTFGGPADLDEVGAFMRSIMRREPSDEQLDGTRRKYLTIGGASPLPALAERLAAQLERALSGLPPADEPESAGMFGGGSVSVAGMRAGSGVKVPVAVGMLHSAPHIGDAVAALAEHGVRELAWVSLSPFDAEVTVGAYRAAVEAEGAKAGMRVFEAAPYRASEPFVQFYGDAVSEAMHELDVLKHKTLVVFSAHSLPVADVAASDAYVQQLREAAREVAALAGLGQATGFHALEGIDAFGGPGLTAPWLLAFQSKGARGGDWLGPDLIDVIDAAAAAGFQAVLVCPVGFALDHMETLYDIDVLAAGRALDAGMEFVRTPVPNDDPRMVEALVRSVRRVL
jgi:protoporphyrin/coproporphyrin ferrochelatase